MTRHVAHPIRTSNHEQSLIDTVSDTAICILDLDGFITSWSLGAQRTNGYLAAEIIGRNFSTVFKFEDAAGTNSIPFFAAIQQQGGAEDEGWRLRKDGTISRARVLIDRIQDQDGQTIGYATITRDITDAGSIPDKAHQAADHLRTMNALLRRAEAMTHVGHWHLDLRTRVMHWSDEVFRIFGLPSDVVPSLEAAIASHHPDDRHRLEKLSLDAIRTGAAYHTEARILQPGGAVRHISSQAEPEYDPDGALAALVGTFHDCTERHKLEAELRHSERQEAIGRLCAGIAHDFNNVLQGIIGSLELITDPSIPASDQQTFANIALKSARRGASITSALLSYAGKQILRPKRVILASVLGEFGKTLAPVMPKGVQLVVSCRADCPAVEADIVHLQTALHHLAINAMHAMPSGGTLTLQAQASRSGATITVSDTGLGMDTATLSQAFEPFFTTRRASGSGLGLSAVQGFARQSGGDVQILSTPGRGTQVEILLPVMPPEAGQIAMRPSPGSAKRVLLVDDDADVLLTAAAFLQAAGFEVLRAGTPDAAKSHLNGLMHIDALITDYSIPGMSGIDLITYARGIHPNLPALLITGYTELAEMVTLPNAVQLLGKPFRRNVLISSVKQVIETGFASRALLQAVPT